MSIGIDIRIQSKPIRNKVDSIFHYFIEEKFIKDLRTPTSVTVI